MARYTLKNLPSLGDKIRTKASEIDKAAANTINKAATFATVKSIELITTRVNLKSGYIKEHVKTASRASPLNLQAIVRANARATHLARYPYSATKQGVRVSVNKGAGFRLIPKSFIARNLKGSLSTGVAMRNTDALAYMESQMHKGQGGTVRKVAKLNRLRKKAKQRPRGIEVEHSRSINQLFLSVREDIEPALNSFMQDEFFKQLGKRK